jgi:hypothetical protein
MPARVRVLPKAPAPTAQELLAGWGEQLADPTVLALLRAAVEGGRRGEVRLFFSNRGEAVRRPAIYIDPVTAEQ